MKSLVKLVSAVLLISLLAGCFDASAGFAPSQEPMPEPAPEPTPRPKEKVELLLEGMSAREKVGQLFFIRPDSLDFSLTPEQINDASSAGVTGMTDGMAAAIAEYPAGGVVIFGKNIESASQLSALMSGLEEASGLSLVFAVDEEGGSVSRIANSGAFNVPKYVSMGDVASFGGAENVKDACAAIGGYLKELGFTLDFAPVADVNTNPDNTVIGARAFGSDPTATADMVAAAVEGFHSAKTACCIKHFPGHGDTTGDTHDGFVSIEKDWDELKAAELRPFEAGIAAGADLVMAAHISVPAVTGDDTPASMSYLLLTQKLRDELGFTGVTVTDSLAMGAVTQRYSPAEAAVSAFKAGTDILLMPQDYRAAFDGVLAAVTDGSISQQRLDESVLRILRLKEEYGLLA